MKRLHVHIAVDDLQRNIEFYSSLFASQPSLVKEDYAKWMLDDPRVNFSISDHGRQTGIDHLGIQAETSAELESLEQAIQQADAPIRTEEGVGCCYARSDKHWTLDPQGIAWETFHSMAEIPTYHADPQNDDSLAECCEPAAGEEKQCC